MLLCAGVASAQKPDIGSLQNARVAIDTDAGKKELTFVAAPMPEEDLAALKKAAPNLRILTASSAEEALALAPEAHGAYAVWCNPEFLRAAGKLVWVQAPSAGVERYLAREELRDSDRIVFTNMQGVHGRAIANHVFAMLLALTRDLRYRLQPDQRAVEAALPREPAPLRRRRAAAQRGRQAGRLLNGPVSSFQGRKCPGIPREFGSPVCVGKRPTRGGGTRNGDGGPRGGR